MKKQTVVPRLSWLVPILAAAQNPEPEDPLNLDSDQMMSLTASAVDANNTPVPDVQLNLYSSDQEIAGIENGNLVPTGRKFSKVSVLGVVTGPAGGLMVTDIEVIPGSLVPFKITEEK